MTENDRAEIHESQDATAAVAEIAEALAGPGSKFNPSNFDSKHREASMTAAEWESFPEISASDLRAALMKTADQIDPSGLTIRGVRISGQFSLDSFDLRFPILFDFVHFETMISLVGAIGSSFSMRNSLMEDGADLSSTKFSAGIFFENVISHGSIILSETETSKISATGLKIVRLEQLETSEYAPLLALQGARVAGDCLLMGSTIDGIVNALRVRINGCLDFTSALIGAAARDDNREDYASLSLGAARIDAGLFMDNTVVHGRVDAMHAQIGGSVQAQGFIVLSDSPKRGVNSIVNLSGTHVNGSVRFDSALFDGAVDLGGITCRSVTLTDAFILGNIRDPRSKNSDGSNRYGVELTSAEVSEDLELKRSVVLGDVRADRMRVGGQVNINRMNCTGDIKLTNSEFGSVQAQQIRTHAGDMAMNSRIHNAVFGRRNDFLQVEGAKAKGSNATRKGLRNGFRHIVLSDLDAMPRHTCVVGRERSGQVDFSGTKIGRNLTLWIDRIARGVSLSRVAIGGNLEMDPASLPQAHCPAIFGDLDVENLKVEGRITLPGSRPIVVHGRLIASRASSVGTVDLAGIRVINSPRFSSQGRVSGAADADLSGVKLDHLILSNTFRHISLDGATIGHLQLGPADKKSKIASLTETRHLAIERVTTPGGKTSESVGDWLLRSEEQTSKGHPEFFAQPWLAAADSYANGGLNREARKLRYQATDEMMKNRGAWYSPLARQVLRGTMGYGFNPERALLSLGVLWVLAFSLGVSFPDSFSPTDRSAALSVTLEAPATASAPEAVAEPATAEISEKEEVVQPATGNTRPVPSAYAGFQAGLYAVDIVAPAIQTGQFELWRINSEWWLVVAFSVIRGLSWAVLGLFVTGIAGFFKAK